MKLSKKILAKLGLEEGATDEEVEAALEGALPEGTPPAPAPTPAPEGTPPATPPAPAAPPAPEEETGTPPAPALGAVPAGFRLVDEDAWTQTQARLASVEASHVESAKKERDAFLRAAVKEGKFPPASLGRYQGLWETDPEGTKATVTKLAAGTIPVNARGLAEDDADIAATGGQTYPEWLRPAAPGQVAAAAGQAAPPVDPAHVHRSGGLTIINA